MTPEEQYAVFVASAKLTKLSLPTPPTTTPVRGRFFATLLVKALKFWERHRDTILPFLEVAVTAALDLLVANLSNVQGINPPGPD